jgi:hypothetical protein
LLKPFRVNTGKLEGNHINILLAAVGSLSPSPNLGVLAVPPEINNPTVKV